MTVGHVPGPTARLAHRAAALLGALAMAGLLTACGSISEKMAGPMSSLPGIGMPENTPERPAEARAFPAVHDMPPPRADALLDGGAQQRFEAELVAARNEQKVAAAGPPPELPPPPPAAAKPAAKPAAAKPAAKPAKPKPAAKPAKPAAAETTSAAPTSSNRTIY